MSLNYPPCQFDFTAPNMPSDFIFAKNINCVLAKKKIIFRKMQNNSKSFFRIKPLTKYDFRPYVEPGKRKWILETAIKTHPKLDCRGKREI